LPDRYNDGYHIMGDAVVVPVVAWLETHLLRHIAAKIGVLALQRA
jgi:DNA (cytosine-5)-methyltransferase 1